MQNSLLNHLIHLVDKSVFWNLITESSYEVIYELVGCKWIVLNYMLIITILWIKNAKKLMSLLATPLKLLATFHALIDKTVVLWSCWIHVYLADLHKLAAPWQPDRHCWGKNQSLSVSDCQIFYSRIALDYTVSDLI